MGGADGVTAAPVSRFLGEGKFFVFRGSFNEKKEKVCLATNLFSLRVPGLEPGAFWFVAKRSIQLGYIRLIDGPNIAYCRLLSRVIE